MGHFKHLSADRPAIILSLYAFFLVYVSARLIDVIIDGFDYAKSAFIITSEVEKVSDLITKEMDRSATILLGQGLYSGEDRKIVYTVLPGKEIGTLTQKVKQIDGNAFVILNTVHEVLGEGFRRRF